MPKREVLTEDSDVCALSQRWSVDLETIQRVKSAALAYNAETQQPVWIISGWRSREHQRRLSRQGRPTAADDRSTHRSCPATGVDISLGTLPSNFMKATWGRFTLVHGLRWGGGGPVFESGIPKDWQHVDLGPRQ